MLVQRPLNPSGKLDRKTLAARASNDYAAAFSEEATADPAMVPRQGVEACVADVWSAVLGLPSVFRSTRFGEAGGDSLSAVRVVKMLAQQQQQQQPPQRGELVVGGGVKWPESSRASMPRSSGNDVGVRSHGGAATLPPTQQRLEWTFPLAEQTLEEYAAAHILSVGSRDVGAQNAAVSCASADAANGSKGQGSSSSVYRTVTMLPEHCTPCLEMFLRTFATSEPLLVHLRAKPEELGVVIAPLAKMIAAAGLSIVALDERGRIVGCAWNVPLEAHQAAAAPDDEGACHDGGGHSGGNSSGDGGAEAEEEALPGRIGFALGLLEELEMKYCTSDGAANDVANGNVLNLFASTVDLDVVADGLALVERMETLSLDLAKEKGFLRAFTICTNVTTEFLALHRHGFAEVGATEVTDWAPLGFEGPSPFCDLPPPHRAVVCEKIF